ncbi:DUF6241 domain-containing protein [Bacillus salacetis]|uniref:DUF6241 domain-containing protein n=1 Tax=Bacillus salacetis TaxID=2315464 RepID=UPI003BA30145
MTTTKKRALIILIILLFGTVTACSVFIYFSERESGGRTIWDDNGLGKADGEEDTQPTGDKENPFGEPFISPIKEDIMQQYIHALSHQKVEAEKKWSFYEITDDRILYLLNELDYGDYTYKETYREILNRWYQKDFSEADRDHNRIWSLLGGTVGKAEGVLSKKEEKQFIESQRSEHR